MDPQYQGAESYMEHMDYEAMITEARTALKEFRELNLMTQKEFADALDWSQAEVSLLENGKMQWSLKKIVEVCNTFSVHPLVFLPKLKEIFFDMQPTEIQDFLNLGTKTLKKKLEAAENEPE